MPWQVDRQDAAAKMKHIDFANLGTRAIPGMQVLLNDDFGKWGWWAPGPPDGKLMRMKGGDPVEGSYLSKTGGDGPNDVYFHFVHVTTQHLLWPELEGPAEALRADVLNLAATMHTLRVLHKSSVKDGEKNDRSARVQLEYTILACRSMFDLAQQFLAAFHRRVQWVDPELEKRRKAREMPKGFADVAIKAHERVKTKEEIGAVWGLVDDWIDFYVKHSPFLFALRRLRDGIAHHGDEVPFLLNDKRGFLVRADDPDVKALYKFPDEHMLPGNPNRLGALTSLMAFIINSTIEMLDEMAMMLQKFKLPPSAAPGYTVIMRDPHLHLLGEGRLPCRPQDDPWYHYVAPPTK